MQNNTESTAYYIPPNFIDSGTVFGGAFKIRNLLEACTVAATVGIPILLLPLDLTMRIILLCLTSLPLGILTLIGIEGESLSSFIVAFFKFLRGRRVLQNTQSKKQISAFLPIEKIENGIIYTKDHRYVKIIEVMPINFLLRSPREQQNIIYSFISYLKISPVKVQFKCLTKRANLDRHTELVRREMEKETDPNCKMLQEDYLHLIHSIGSKEAITRRSPGAMPTI